MTDIWVEVGVQVAIGIATLAAVRTKVAELERRQDGTEDALRDLPDDYVPRKELDRALHNIEANTGRTHELLHTLLSGGGSRELALKAVEASAGAARDPVSESRLAEVHPDLRRRVLAAMDELAKQGTYFRVAQGLRTYAEQNALFAQGRSAPGHKVTDARGGYSNHNFGCAVDCYPFLSGPTGDLNWNPNTPQFLAMIHALKAQGLEWGGDWNSFKDYPHFQLAYVPVTPTDTDRAVFEHHGLLAVWAQYKSPEETSKP